MSEEREYIKFEGKCLWAQVLHGQAKAPYEIEDKNKDDLTYKINVECPKHQFKKLLEKGLLKKYELKEEEDGTTYITLKATKQKTMKDKEPLVFPDVLVIDKARKPIPADKQIGNGSTVICIAELQDMQSTKIKGKILRLKCVQVLEHVAYEKKESIAAFSDMLENEPTEEDKEQDKLMKALDTIEEGNDDYL